MYSYSARAKTLGYYRKNNNLTHFTSHQNAVLTTLMLHDFFTYSLPMEFETVNNRVVKRKSRGCYKCFFENSIGNSNLKFSRSITMILLSSVKSFLVERENGQVTFDRDYSEIKKIILMNKSEIYQKLNDLLAQENVTGDPGVLGKNALARETMLDLFINYKNKYPSLSLPEISNTVLTPEFEYGEIQLAELKDEWSSNLVELEDRVEELKEILTQSESGEERSSILAEVDKVMENISILTIAIAYLSSGNFGYCSICQNEIEATRLLNAETSVTCGC